MVRRLGVLNYLSCASDLSRWKLEMLMGFYLNESLD